MITLVLAFRHSTENYSEAEELYGFEGKVAELTKFSQRIPKEMNDSYKGEFDFNQEIKVNVPV